MASATRNIDSIFNLESVRSEPGTNLWVFNSTPSLKGERQKQKNSVIHLLVTMGNEKTLVRIPTTWVPVNIGLQAPKKALFESPDFLKAINNGYIKPITNKEAMEFYKDNEEAAAEYDMANSKMSRTAPDRDTAEDKEVAKPSGFVQDLNAGEIEETDLNPKIIQAVAKIKSGEIKEVEFSSILRNSQHDLTDEDMEYVMANVSEPNIHKLINKIKNG
jgi:hypothetical protein